MAIRRFFRMAVARRRGLGCVAVRRSDGIGNYKNANSAWVARYVKARCAEDPEYHERVKAVKRESARRHAGERKTEYAQRKALGICARCGVEGRPLVTKTMCASCKEGADRQNRKITEAVFEHYGRACVCCGEDCEAFLTLDHINNDGAVQRRESGGVNYRTLAVRRSLRTGEWPADLQILCWNCNGGKRVNNGVCPHKDTRFQTSNSRDALRLVKSGAA